MNEETQKFRNKFKEDLIEWLQLEDITPQDIKDDEPLFGTGLELDSLDAVEIVIMLQRHYSIRQEEIDKNRSIFTTLATLCDFVQKRLADGDAKP